MDKDLEFLKEIFKMITDLFKQLMEAFRGIGNEEPTTEENA